MTEMRELEKVVEEILGELDRDRRSLFTRVRRDGEGYCLDSSDRDALRQVLPRVRARMAQASMRGAVLPAPELCARSAWVTASVAGVRRQPSHQSEQVTQALQGEVLVPLLHEDGWLLVRLPDGYVGWVRDWHLGLVDTDTPGTYARRANARIAVPLACVREVGRPTATPRAEALLGTHVVSLRTADAWTEIELPGGRRGWVRGDQLRPGTHAWPAGVPAILDTLHVFLGVPYVWGGKSPKGFDCSGLVQFVFGLHGVDLPRDSDQQFACGEAVEEFLPGDLIFFGRESIGHVGVACDAREFLHARGEVRRDSLDPGSPHHDPELAAVLRGGRRVLPRMP
ncbi:MAG: NlpC/P60 family protein [Candidatus Krumholzibacteriia bacterium]